MPGTPTDTTLPNIVRPTYNDLRTADDAVEADSDDAELEGSSSQTQVNTYTILKASFPVNLGSLVGTWYYSCICLRSMAPLDRNILCYSSCKGTTLSSLHPLYHPLWCRSLGPYSTTFEEPECHLANWMKHVSSDLGLFSPLYKNIKSFTKLEAHNILHCRQRRTEPRSQITCTENLVKFGQVVRCVSGQTDRQTCWSQCFAPIQGRSNNSLLSALASFVSLDTK